jgi:hypothetical protein
MPATYFTPPHPNGWWPRPLRVYRLEGPPIPPSPSVVVRSDDQPTCRDLVAAVRVLQGFEGD